MAFYRYFESKDGLLYFVRKRHVDRLLLPMIAGATREVDPEIRPRKFLVDYALLLTHDPSLRVLINETKRFIGKTSRLPGDAIFT